MEAENEAPAPEAGAPAMTQDEAEKLIVKKFSEMRDEKQKIAQKISEMNLEKNEHA